jgi:hypothetical protein
VAVWDALDRTPGYAAMVRLLQQLFGVRIADELRAPFALGDPGELRELFAEAGVPAVGVQTRDGTARFPSLEAWVRTDVKGWTLADLIDDQQYRTLLDEAGMTLGRFVGEGGAVAFRSPAHLATATKA